MAGLAKFEYVVGRVIFSDSKLGHNVCLMSGCILMQESEVLMSCFGAPNSVVLLQFSKYNIL